MEAGLKRLWIRQRTKSRSGDGPDFKQTPTYEVHLSGPPPQLGSLPFKPSQAESSGKYGHNKAKSESLPPELRKLASAGSEARPRSAGGGGIQPVFLGVSRPMTASSLAIAVTQAADNAALGRLTTNNTLPAYAPSWSRVQTVSNAAAAFKPARSKPPKSRYVDIFQITAQSRTIGNKYNEDVASRNLDLRQVALGTPVDGYDSTSRYQEEVAIRNASIELPRTSADTSRYSHDENQESYESAPEATHHAYIHNGANGDDSAARTRQPEDHQQLQQHRMYSTLAKTFVSRLPAIPQQSPGETDGDMKPWVGEKQRQETKPRAQKEPSLQRKQPKSPPQTFSGHREVSSTRNPPRDIPANSATQFNTGRPLMNGPGRGHNNISATSMPLYRLSPAELSTPRSHLVRSNSARSTSTNDTRIPIATQGSLQDGSSVYSSSIQSKASTLKKSVNLSNRTIMDLTGDDTEIFSDSVRPESYTESPVLHQAKFSPLVIAQPAIVTTPVEREPKGVADPYTRIPGKPLEEPQPNSRSNPSANEMQPELIMPEEQISNTGEIDASSQTGSITPQASSPPKITFSKINTVASMSPRSSLIASNITSPLDSALPDAIEGVLQRLNTLPAPPAETPNVAQEPVVSTLMAEEENAEDSAPAPYVHASLPDMSNGVATSRSRNINTLPSLSENASEPPTPVAEPNQRTGTKRISPLVLQASPESLRSTDFVHPGSTFGVHARDFAAIPKSPALVQKGEATSARPTSRPSSRPTSRARTMKQIGYVPNGVSPSPKLRPATAPGSVPAPAYTFDEEDFARKQAAAKAALLRLKQSLEDDGAAPEEPAAPPNTNNRVPRAVRRPYIPNSIYSARPKELPDKPEQHNQQTPSASYHTQVTAPSPAASTHSTNSPRRAGHGTWYSKRDSINSSDENYYDADASSFAYTHHPSPGAGAYIQRLRTYDDIHTKVPASPGDISLSSFPLNLPVHSPIPGQAMPQEQQVPRPSRRNSHVSQRSMSSTASAFSIPYHMVPGRSSSMRNFDDGFSLDGDPERERD